MDFGKLFGESSEKEFNRVCSVSPRNYSTEYVWSRHTGRHDGPSCPVGPSVSNFSLSSELSSPDAQPQAEMHERTLMADNVGRF